MSDGNDFEIILKSSWESYSNSVWNVIGDDASKFENPVEHLLGYLCGNPCKKGEGGGRFSNSA